VKLVGKGRGNTKDGLAFAEEFNKLAAGKKGEKLSRSLLISEIGGASKKH